MTRRRAKQIGAVLKTAATIVGAVDLDLATAPHPPHWIIWMHLAAVALAAAAGAQHLPSPGRGDGTQ